MFCDQCIDYGRSGISYNLIDDAALPTIERTSYGVQSLCENSANPTDPPRVKFAPVEQSIFQWQGTEYEQISRTELQPEYIVDTEPLTETINIGVNEITVQFVYEWTADCDGLWKTLTALRLSDDSRVLLRQSFKILVTGDPAEGLFVRDVDDDGIVEIIECEHIFPSSIKLKEEPWPLYEPACTTYHWDTTKQQFAPQTESN
jgi:hypothetical protein